MGRRRPAQKYSSWNKTTGRYPCLYRDREFAIIHEQSPHRKTSLPASLGISRISMFNLSFALVQLYIRSAVPTLGLPSRCVKFPSSLFSFRSLRHAAENKSQRASLTNGEKAEFVSGSTEVTKSPCDR